MRAIWTAIFSSNDISAATEKLVELNRDGTTARLDLDGDQGTVLIVSNREEIAAHQAQMSVEKAVSPGKFYSWIGKG